MAESSGPQWCARFPGSALTSDLADPFRERVDTFIAMLRSCGATVVISATYRPPERAFLMHYCCLVAGYRDKAQVFHQIDPKDVPAMDGIDIDWTHGGDLGAARAAAVAMRTGYGIVYPAALVSRHTQRLAIDMSISWKGTLAAHDAQGRLVEISSQPRDQTNAMLAVVGKSFGVIKLASDPPHWSQDGH